ncbi:MAG: HD domain-containing protein [Chloroflexi bacterium]|nr:HD domain-containing protein [Chloroflexota bacterium]
MSKGRSKVFIRNADVKQLAPMVASLADQGFEVTSSHTDNDPGGKLDAGFDLVVHIFGGNVSGSPEGALVLCKTKSSLVPIGIICPGIPEIVFADRIADLVRTSPEKARLRTEASKVRQSGLVTDICKALANDSGEDGIREALAMLSREAGVDVAFLFLAEGGRTISERAAVATGGGEPLERLVGLAAEGRKPQLAATPDSAPVIAGSEMKAKGVRSAIAIPLLFGERLAGVFLATRSRSEGQFGERDIETLGPLVRLIVLFWEGARAARRSDEASQSLTKATSLVEQREREIKALNALLQNQQGRMLAIEENTHIDRERYLAATRFIVASLESADPNMRLNSERVATWALMLAQSMNLSVEGLAEAAYLHDIGHFKIVRDYVERENVRGGSGAAAERTAPDADKPGRSMNTPSAGTEADHSIVGEAMARLLKLSPEVRLAIRHHHENYDGSGFPDSLSGDKIPLAARLIRVADAYVSMSLPATGKDRLIGGRALDRIRAGMRKEYDPVVVEALVKLAEKRERPSEEGVISTVSHELRSPLTYLVGYSELLASAQELPPAAKEAAKEIYAEATHMARLVDDMLDLSRLEMGHADMQFSDVDLARVIERSVAKARLKSAAHKVEQDIGSDLPCVQGNADRLTQVLDNLLDNAIKYSPDGGRVLVKASVLEREVLVAVSDQGIGMPKDKLKLIFEKFQRLDSPLKHKVSGTGIGLNLCRRIVEAHGGSIWAESEEGKGSTLSFSLPVKL